MNHQQANISDREWLSHSGQLQALSDRNPEIIRSFLPFYEWVYQYYFRVQTDGWHYIPPKDPVLLVGSHNGGLAAPDMHMFMYDWYLRFGCERLVYGLMEPKVWRVFPQVARRASQFGAIRAHPKLAIAALKQNSSLLVYPGGAKDIFRPHSMRNKIYFAGSKAFIKLALRQNIPIIPLISWGAHDTLIVLGDCYKWARQLHQLGMPWLFDVDPEVFPIYLGLPWGISFGALPNIPFPKQIHTRVCPPIEFPRYGRETLKDRAYIDDCYDLVVRQMQDSLDRLIVEVG